MSATYRYRTHGLTIESAIELPELSSGDGDPDVVIEFGSVPECLEGEVTHGPNYQAAAGQYLLDMPGIARYWVSAGRDVRIARAPGAADEDIRVFLLSAVMGALAHQRGCLVIHASAIEIGGRCVLLAGESGAGKSTLAAAFHDRGYRIVTDDICVIVFDAEAQPVVHPGHRHVRLWADALRRVGHSLGARRKVRVGLQKYSVLIPSPVPETPLRIARMFLLTRRLTDTIELQPVTGRAKVNALVRETYRRPTMAALGKRAAHFEQCLALGRRIPVVRVHRPLNLDDIGRLVDVLEDDLPTAAGTRA